MSLLSSLLLLLLLLSLLFMELVSAGVTVTVITLLSIKLLFLKLSLGFIVCELMTKLLLFIPVLPALLLEMLLLFKAMVSVLYRRRFVRSMERPVPVSFSTAGPVLGKRWVYFSSYCMLRSINHSECKR